MTDVLFENIEVRTGERTQRIPSVRALLRTTMNRAIRGDHKFVMAVIAFIRLSGLPENNIDAFGANTDTNADLTLLVDFFKRHPELAGFSDLSNAETATTDFKSREDKNDVAP
jgi:hypothetical protein